MRNLLVVGGARCVWDDLAAFRELRIPADVMGVNWTALFYPGVLHHMVSMHGPGLIYFAAFRRQFRGICVKGHKGLHSGIQMFTKEPEAFICHGPSAGTGIDRVWSPANAFATTMHGGSSGCYAAAIGLALEYDRVILAGCPADDTGNFYDPPWINDNFTGKRKVWEKADALVFKGRVKSMSGWTRKRFGAPE